MSNYKDLSELLESNEDIMHFYNTLPIGLQQKMYKGGVDAFLHLYECEKNYNPPQGERNLILTAASANECTGLIRNGADRTYESWLEYENLEPFGIPEYD